MSDRDANDGGGGDGDGDDDYSNWRPALHRAVDTALLRPLRVAASKPARRAYLGTFLVAATALLLLAASAAAYLVLYYSYVPHIGVERAIHLQFGSGDNHHHDDGRRHQPHGTAALAAALVCRQAYDVSVLLHLPRTPANVAAGNFMLDVSLLAPADGAGDKDDDDNGGNGNGLRPPAPPSPRPSTGHDGSGSAVARSRRPAILRYRSPMVDSARSLGGLPWYALGWKSESEMLEVVMFEGVEFARGWRNVPDRVRLVVESRETMQFYEVAVRVRARFRGLRWLLYNHRILSFALFTTAFFSVSMVSALVMYLAFLFYTSLPAEPASGDKEGGEVKSERPASDSEGLAPFSASELSDTPRTFPTLARQMPLRFPGRGGAARRGDDDDDRIKREDEKEMTMERTTGSQPLVGEADDEDDDEDHDEDEDDFDDEDYEGSAWRDSGIGTGVEEVERRAARRRKGRG